MRKQTAMALCSFAFLLCLISTAQSAAVDLQVTVAIDEFTKLVKQTHSTLDFYKTRNQCSSKSESGFCQLVNELLPEVASLKSELAKKQNQRSEEFLEKVVQQMAEINQQSRAYFLENQSQVNSELSEKAPDEILRIDSEIDELAAGNDIKKVAGKLNAHLDKKLQEIRKIVVSKKWSEWKKFGTQLTGLKKEQAEQQYEEANLQHLTLLYECMAVVAKLDQLQQSASPMDEQKEEQEKAEQSSSPLLAHYEAAKQYLSIAMLQFSVSNVNFMDEALDTLINFAMVCAGGLVALVAKMYLAKFMF